MCWHGVRVGHSLPLMGKRHVEKECSEERHPGLCLFTDTTVTLRNAAGNTVKHEDRSVSYETLFTDNCFVIVLH